eukprot:4045838-Alexandrium_andersonii.AAC.1
MTSVAAGSAYRVLTGPCQVPGAPVRVRMCAAEAVSMECGDKDEPGARGAGQRSPATAAESGDG